MIFRRRGSRLRAVWTMLVDHSSRHGRLSARDMGHRNLRSRELNGLGHTVRLMPPVYVKPYVKRQKNDAADAEAICEAVNPLVPAIVECVLLTGT
jgi:transposase